MRSALACTAILSYFQSHTVFVYFGLIFAKLRVIVPDSIQAVSLDKKYDWLTQNDQWTWFRDAVRNDLRHLDDLNVPKKADKNKSYSGRFIDVSGDRKVWVYQHKEYATFSSTTLSSLAVGFITIKCEIKICPVPSDYRPDEKKVTLYSHFFLITEAYLRYTKQL